MTPATDDVVAAAVAQHRAWQSEAVPSATPNDRVLCRISTGKMISRKPIKGRTGWQVQYCGRAYLIDPHDVNGDTVFRLWFGRLPERAR